MVAAYQEAAMIFRGSGQMLFHATAGGKLEEFGLRSVLDLCPSAKAPKEV